MTLTPSPTHTRESWASVRPLSPYRAVLAIRPRRSPSAAGSNACATMSATSVIGFTSSASSTSAGTSSRSGSLRCGMKTVDRPARCAASSFCLTPPIGSTRPFSVTSPVIPTSDAHLASGGHRHQRGDHRHTRRRAVLGHRARGHVHVDPAVQRLGVDAQLLGVRAHVGQRDLRRLLHHVAQLTGQLQTRLALRWPLASM